MGTGRQQQGESQTDNKLVRKLLHRCERLQQQVDSLMPQQVQRSLPEKTQVGSWQHGGLYQDPLSVLTVMWSSPLLPPTLVWTWQEIKALIPMSG